MLVIPHRFKKIGVHNLVVRRIFSDILLVLGLKKVEKHCSNTNCIKGMKKATGCAQIFSIAVTVGNTNIISLNWREK
jgi:hypothetical protein